MPSDHQEILVVDEQLTKDKQSNFSKLWVKSYPAVGAYVTSLVPDHNCAEEILGRVSVILVEKMDQYDGERSFEAWAIGIARYEILKYRREKARDRLRFSEEILNRIGDQCEKISSEMSSQQWALQKCLEEIAGRAAQALTLRYSEDFRYKAIASRLGMEVGAVRTMLHRTRDALRRCVEQRLEREFDGENY